MQEKILFISIRIRSYSIASVEVARPRRIINTPPGGNPSSSRSLNESELVLTFESENHKSCELNLYLEAIV